MVYFAAQLSVYVLPLLATSGWDAYDTVIRGYRLHGKHGASMVHRASEDVRQSPPLLEVKVADGLIGPPNYAPTDAYMVLRYQPTQSDANVANHYLIHFAGEQVFGPMTTSEWLSNAGLPKYPTEWRTPPTAADTLQFGYVLAKFSAFLLVALVMYLLVLLFRSYSNRLAKK